MTQLPKIICVVGPTATGKSDLAVLLALKLNGEIISADSRQVYTGLDLGTGKITKEEMMGVTHHLLDVADPKERFTVSDWVLGAQKAIKEIISRGRVPVICGGTGFYVSALIENSHFPEITIQPGEQEQLEQKDTEELFKELQVLDLRRAGEIDKHNKRRVARAILIARELGCVPQITKKEPIYDVLWIGTTIPDEKLRQRINIRLVKRMDAGMLEEVKTLNVQNLSHERMNEIGLEYRYLSQLMQGNLSEKDFYTTLSAKIWQYAKRQKTWFKRNKLITWFNPKDSETILNEAQKFLIK
jgi:tRNA dimethylallyltransferase